MTPLTLFRTKAQALDTHKAICGGLTNTSKMPGCSFSLPAAECQTGSKLRKVPGSTCASCYACRGQYGLGDVKAAQYRRYDALPADETGWARWEATMTAVIATVSKPDADGFAYFRWHDSGDVQSERHLLALFHIADALPAVRFWLPTKEYAIVHRALRETECPENICIRISAPMIDQPSPTWTGNGSSVHTTQTATQTRENGEHLCPAPTQGGACGACRACWRKDVEAVSYHAH